MRIEMEMEMQMEMHIKMWRGKGNQRQLREKTKSMPRPKDPLLNVEHFRKWIFLLFSNVNLLSCRVRGKERVRQEEQSGRAFLWFSFRCQSDFGADVLEQRVRVQS